VRLKTIARVRACYFLVLCVVFFSLDCPFSLSLSRLSFFSPETTLTVCVFFLPKNRFEFAAPKYYDFVSHNSAEGKKNRSKETETAEMYFESEKPSGASRAFCSFYSQRERESLSPPGKSRFLPFWEKGDFFLKIREGAHFSSLFAKRARKTFSRFFLSLSLSVSLSLCVCSPRDEIN